MKKAFTLIEILITLAIISLAVVGISALTGNQVTKLKDRIIREQFITTYNTVLLNSISSSNTQWSWEYSLRNELVIYDGRVLTTWSLLFSANGLSDYLVYRNGLPWTATIVFDNYALWCAISDQTGLQMIEGITLVKDNEKKPIIWCFMIDLGTCKLIEQYCPNSS